MDGYQIAAIITASGTFLVSLTGLVLVFQTRREVKTGNGLMIGQLANRAESRRIDDIPPADQTQEEKDHQR